MAFNLNDLMNNASKEQAAAIAPAYEVLELNTADLLPNEKNTIYSIDNIEELKNAIELAGGIKQNLVVEPADADGKYKIIAGHRRWTAAKELAAEGKEQYNKVPCLIEKETDAAKRELLLIYTNASARELTDAEKARQSQRATELLTEIKNREGITGRVRDLVANMLNTTAAQIGRYQAINKNLVNEDLKTAFEAGDLKVSAAYEASKLDEEGQAAAAERLEEKNGLTIADVKEIQGPPPGPKMVEFTDDGQQIEHTGADIDTNLQAGGGVTELDTEPEEKKWTSESGFVPISAAEMIELNDEVVTTGSENMDGCRLCALRKGCKGCCVACKNECNVKQVCQYRKPATEKKNGANFDSLPDEMTPPEVEESINDKAYKKALEALEIEIGDIEFKQKKLNDETYAAYVNDVDEQREICKKTRNILLYLREIMENDRANIIDIVLNLE